MEQKDCFNIFTKRNVLNFTLSSHIYKNGDMDLSSTGNDVTNPLPSVAKLVDTGNGDEEEEDDSLNRCDNVYHMIPKVCTYFHLKFHLNRCDNVYHLILKVLR
jgi:hypothetical protein